MLTMDEIMGKVSNGEITKMEALELLKEINEGAIADVKVNKASPYVKEDGLKGQLQSEEIEKKIGAILCNVLHLANDDIDPTLNFKDMGIDSISSVEIVRDINKEFDSNLDAVVLYDYNTVTQLSEYMATMSIKNDYSPDCKSKEIKNENGQMVDLKKVIDTVKKILGNILHLSIDEIENDLSFKEIGVDSITGIEIIRDINKEYKLNLDAATLYDYSNLLDISEYIASIVDEKISDEKSMELLYAKNHEKKAGLEEIYHDKHYKEMRKDFIKEETKIETLQSNGAKIKLKSFENNEEKEEIPLKKKSNLNYDGKIAIIGISGRFPGANNVDEFWENIKTGRDCITEISEQHYLHMGADPDEVKKAKGNEHWHMGVLDGIDEFEPLFFNISPIEASVCDPQQRVFLMEAWRALEDAGYTENRISGNKCGVYVGSTMGDYQDIINRAEITNEMDIFTGISPSILPARISYFLNLKGPSLSIDTACSSSLVAIQQACNGILCNDCEIALAGGVRLMLTPTLHKQTSNAGMISKTGRCRPFDQEADGIVLGEAVGAIVLKSAQKAMEDGDHIYGIIRSIGINQDGKTNGITAPSALSQTALEKEVYAKGNVNPEDISYVETHGTGTKLGDPIEVKALKNAFAAYTTKTGYCAIGSVKGNIGHTTMAAGVCSVIKVLLAMKHRQLPPLVHFEQLNEHISLEESPFYINKDLTEWKTDDNKPLMAAVSSFGFSGTNCHLVIEEFLE